MSRAPRGAALFVVSSDGVQRLGGGPLEWRL
jgi:hypothetical protein